MRKGATTRARTARSDSSARAGSFSRTTSTRARSPTMCRGKPSGVLSSTNASGSAASDAVTSSSGSRVTARCWSAWPQAERAAVRSSELRTRWRISCRAPVRGACGLFIALAFAPRVADAVLFRFSAGLTITPLADRRGAPVGRAPLFSGETADSVSHDQRACPSWMLSVQNGTTASAGLSYNGAVSMVSSHFAEGESRCA